MSDLKKRVQALEDIEAIKQLKASYFRAIDKKNWTDLEAVFTVQAIGIYPSGIHEGRAAILSSIINWESPEYVVTTHEGHNPEIELTGEISATGKWELNFYRADNRKKTGQRDAAFYEDDYIKGEDRIWRISRTRIVSIYSETFAVKDTVNQQSNAYHQGDFNDRH